ncbi:hypothetical protein BG006_002713 [Podila minutissima]|uniref:NAD(P)-binding domain-containing protein n=1 Tax=Podila minutissima TaxID=64525 RepID=A0A9P5SR66_9FUNG|nr:hypothetical protein BG006_002713 [Podila minutissima]
MSTPSPLPEPLLAITNCDGYEGQVMALHLAKHLEGCFGHKNQDKSCVVDDDNDDKDKPKKPEPQIVCLARDLSKCKNLQNYRHIKLVEISHDKPETISIALRGLKTVVLVPEMEDNEVDLSDQFVDIMVQEQVIRCILISAIGTDANEKGHLARYRRIEDKVKTSIQRWTILRQGFLFECLYYWITMVQDQGILGMPIGPESEFTPLHIGDLGKALVSVTFPPDDDDDDDDDGDNDSHDQASAGLAKSKSTDTERSDHRTYTLTGSKRVTGPKLAEDLNHALQVHSDDASPPPTVTFKTITRDECKNYFLSLREGTGVPPTEAKEAPGFFASITRSLSQRRPWSFSGLFKSLVDDTQKTVGEDAKKDPKDPKDPKEPSKPKDPKDPKDPKNPKKPSKDRGPQVEPPNDTEVEMMLDLMDYIAEGRATFLSGDMEKITGHQGMGPEEFFKKHGRDFRRRHPKDL